MRKYYNIKGPPDILKGPSRDNIVGIVENSTPRLASKIGQGQWITVLENKNFI